MTAHRRGDLLRHRRRADDEGEEDISTQEVLDDSQSEASVGSDGDEDVDADAEDSDASGTDTADTRQSGNGSAKVNGDTPAAVQAAIAEPPVSQAPPDKFAAGRDTVAMMNGLKISENSSAAEAIDFDTEAVDSTAKVEADSQASTLPAETNPAAMRRKEHEEYKRKRDSDPAFTPTRGAFFMHDHRSAGSGQNGFRPFGRGRGRGRGFMGGPIPPNSYQNANGEPTNMQWSHDLHETLNEPQTRSIAPARSYGAVTAGNTMISPAENPQQRTNPSAQSGTATRSFSESSVIGKQQFRLNLPGMEGAHTFSDVAVYRHIKLPNHRPPLRRDKPVRVALPEHSPKYIFPSHERSFIFIPRAMRPNQQGFGRSRGKAVPGFGGFSSRRSSMYGGSVYSASVPMSRRSSMVRDLREGIASPAGSIMSRVSVTQGEVGRPVVRLPPGVSTPTNAPVNTIGSIPQPQTYPLPQKPAFRENWPAHVPMHQPRPQKAVSVAGIESPAAQNYPAPQPQQEQPFHHQVPAGVNAASGPLPDAPNFYPSQMHSRHLSHPSQASTGTPLSHIPERAIHAQPFQPFQPGYQYAGYPSQGFAPPAGYYYPQPTTGPPAQYPPGTVVAPAYVPAHGAYVLPTMAPPDPAQAGAPQTQAAPPSQSAAPGQGSLVAHESNGMVYYYDPNQYYQGPAEGYTQPANYAVAGPGGMMTPSPEGYYYPAMAPVGSNGSVYYAQ